MQKSFSSDDQGITQSESLNNKAKAIILPYNPANAQLWEYINATCPGNEEDDDYADGDDVLSNVAYAGESPEETRFKKNQERIHAAWYKKIRKNAKKKITFTTKPVNFKTVCITKEPNPIKFIRIGDSSIKIH